MQSIEPPSFLTASEDARLRAVELLGDALRAFPTLLSSCTETLLTISAGTPSGASKSRVSKSAASNSAERISSVAVKLLSTSVSCMLSSLSGGPTALSVGSLERQFPSSFTSRLAKFATCGTLVQAKHCAKALAVVLAAVQSNASALSAASISTVCSRLLRELTTPAVLNVESAMCTAALTSLSQFALAAPIWFMANRGGEAWRFASSVVASGLDAGEEQLLCAIKVLAAATLVLLPYLLS